MKQLLTKVSLLALIPFIILCCLAFAPNEEGLFEPPNSLWKSLVVQGAVLEKEGTRQLSEQERSQTTTEEWAALLALQEMQQFNNDLLYHLDHLFLQGEGGEYYHDEKTVLRLKEYMQELHQQYQDWILQQTKSKTDPRWIALQKRVVLNALEKPLKQGTLGLLQARVAFSQLQQAEQALLAVFTNNKELDAVYWPYDVLRMDWEQPPTSVGIPIKGRIVLGTRLELFPALVENQPLLKLGKSFYYETTPTTLGTHTFQVTIPVENFLKGSTEPASKLVQYQVVAE